MCVLTRRIAEDADLHDLCCRSWQFEKDPEDWSHYDHLGTFIVAARTNLLLDQPPRHAVMVEMIFDGDALLRERDLDTARNLPHSAASTMHRSVTTL